MTEKINPRDPPFAPDDEVVPNLDWPYHISTCNDSRVQAEITTEDVMPLVVEYVFPNDKHDGWIVNFKSKLGIFPDTFQKLECKEMSRIAD